MLTTVAMGPLNDQIQLSGGEATELILGADGRSLRQLATTRDPRFGPLVEAGGSDEPLPTRRSPDPVHERRGAFPSPAEGDRIPRTAGRIVDEVTPLVDDKRSAPSKYIFYDANFEPGTGVPVLNWLAEDWPATPGKLKFTAGSNTSDEAGLVVKVGAAVQIKVPSPGPGDARRFARMTYQVRRPARRQADSPLRVPR